MEVLSSRKRCRLASRIFTDVSEDSSASSLSAELLFLKIEQFLSSKRWHMSTRLHGVNERVGVALTTFTRIPEIPGSNLGRDTD
jgi:hypothetical protein